MQLHNALMHFIKFYSYFLNILHAETRIRRTADGLYFKILYCLKYYLSKDLKKNHN